MKRLAPLACVLLLAACSPSPDLSSIPDTCGLSANSWMPDDDGITVVTYGVSPASEDQVQCILDESGTSQALKNDIWVESTGRRREEERGLEYSWRWSDKGLHLIVRPL